jgi:hypothetical protein
MTNPDDKDKARLKRQRNLVAKYNKYKPKALKKKTEYNRQSNKNLTEDYEVGMVLPANR